MITASVYLLPQQSPRRQPCLIPTLSWSLQGRAAILASWRDCSLWGKHSWTEYWCSWQLLSLNMKTSCQDDCLYRASYIAVLLFVNDMDKLNTGADPTALISFFKHTVILLIMYGSIQCHPCIYFLCKLQLLWQSSTTAVLKLILFCKHDWEHIYAHRTRELICLLIITATKHGMPWCDCACLITLLRSLPLLAILMKHYIISICYIHIAQLQ